MSNNWYPCSSVNSSGDGGALSDLNAAALNNGDRAVVISATGADFYVRLSDGWSHVGALQALSIEAITNYDAVNYPFTSGDVSYISGVYDAIAHGRNHYISGTGKACIIMCGENNSVMNATTGWSVICNGDGNSITGDAGFIGTGDGNSITGDGSTIVNGSGNNVTGVNSTIVNGADGYIAADNAAILSGSGNYVSGANSIITAGTDNYVSGANSIITAGTDHNVSGANSIVLCGSGNNAEATNTVVLNGTGNIAQGAGAVILNGSSHYAGGANSVVCNGSTNAAVADGAFIGTGDNNTATGVSGIIGVGSGNYISAKYGSVLCGEKGSAYLYGQAVHATGLNTTLGKAQVSEIILGASTTDATETEMFLDLARTLRAVLPASRTWKFNAHVVARQSTGESAFWMVAGGIKRDASNNTTLIGTPQGVGTPGENDRDPDIAAQGTITMSGCAVADETFLVDTQTFTWKAARGGTGEVEIGATAADAVTNIVAAITSDLATVTAIDGSGDTVVITASTPGAASNSIGFTESSTNMAVDGSGTLGGTTSGVDVVSNWSVAVTADESLKITVTGEVGKSINWLAKVSLVEIG